MVIPAMRHYRIFEAASKKGCRSCGGQLPHRNIGSGLQKKVACCARCSYNLNTNRTWLKAMCYGCGVACRKTRRSKGVPLCRGCRGTVSKLPRNHCIECNAKCTGKVCKDCNNNITIHCVACAKLFKPTRARSVMCSDECVKRLTIRFNAAKRPFPWLIQRRDKKYRKHAEYVFDRDKFICHLCGHKTDEGLRGTRNSRAPVLDHVLPKSRGGSDEVINLACACYECNAIKGDKLMSELTTQ